MLAGTSAMTGTIRPDFEPVKLKGSVILTSDRIGLDLEKVEVPPIDPNDKRTMLQLIIDRIRDNQPGDPSS
jgi:hypothetical protein